MACMGRGFKELTAWHAWAEDSKSWQPAGKVPKDTTHVRAVGATQESANCGEVIICHIRMIGRCPSICECPDGTCIGTKHGDCLIC
mmetsp:Transcript_84691/g.169135  ORF Transcript_84691/g.169135 Transcript_84691/m.169135 type:complete len:86 (-) Transcript_84691:219-476(-)